MRVGGLISVGSETARVRGHLGHLAKRRAITVKRQRKIGGWPKHPVHINLRDIADGSRENLQGITARNN